MNFGNFILNVKLYYWLKKVEKDLWNETFNKITESDFTQETESNCEVEFLVIES
jgi:hypothetical protein